MFRVLVTDKLSPAGLRVLEETEGIEVDVRSGLSPEEVREALQDAAHIEASEALPAADQVKRIETLKIELEAAELPRPPEGCRNLSEETLRDERLGDLDLEAAVEPAVDLPVAVDWDNMVARLVVLMNVDMGIGPKVWLPGHDDLHSRTIGLFKEVGELKKGHDAGRIWPSPRLAAMSEECAALESLCVDAQSAGTSRASSPLPTGIGVPTVSRTRRRRRLQT